ncbi:helix-turn-helix domain-containing protein [Salinicoccus sp. HZC-1]|uniref:helix-turn-helix domain-containing protein n=1 Tax=Salinicoccus sp. HZC-1 TaxID=3385497 RepID=UPI00398BA348
MSILIIDDDFESSVKIKEILKQSRHSDIKILEANNAADGLKIAKENRPFIVVTELSLKDFNGIEVGKKILSESNATFIIAISQLKMFELVQQAINNGFSGFYLKPVVKNEFLTTIDRLILSNPIINKQEASFILSDNKSGEFEADMSKPIKTAIEYIHLNYFEVINLKDIAEKVYLSPSHFSRMFKEVTDTNFIEFLTQVRIEKSKYFLKSTAMPIEVIAHNIGFSSATYFATTFKKSQGKTPREYRSLYMKLDSN